MSRPLAVTIGDAAGIGVELLWRAWQPLRAGGPLVVVGSEAVVAAAGADLRARLAPTPLGATGCVRVAAPEEAAGIDPQVIPVLDLPLAGLPPLSPYPWAAAEPAFGALQHAALVQAVALAQAGRVAGLVTLPWHKARLADAGLPPTGHTEVLAALAGAGGPVVMMLVAGSLRVGLVTTHLPLAAVPAAIRRPAVRAMGEALLRGLRDAFGIAAPRLAVCGLNPHAGESGTLGREEIDEIGPAIADLSAKGWLVSGPHAADTLLPRAAAGEAACDAVLAMYHDQGLVGLKTAGFGGGVNVTLGLTVVRTSVDHGTAYDIAGRGLAKASSLAEATALARALAARRVGSA